MPVSMKDIAQAAGVTESTVSRALADSPRVKPETRVRIQQLARDLGYVPSAIARGLATRRTSTLGVVLMDVADTFNAEVLLAIDKQAGEHGYSVILSTCGLDARREERAIRLLLQHRVDAVIVADPLAADSSLAELQGLDVPVILINRRNYPYAVGTDSVLAARVAVEHLLDVGHTRIGYIGGARSVAESNDREIGYRLALQARGIVPDPSLIVPGDGWAEGGRRGLEQLLCLPNPPTAVFCFNDQTAAGVLLTAYRAGIPVPADLSVVGFDDSMLASYLVPPLTTMAQQRDELARLALTMLVDLLAGADVQTPDLLPGLLVVRNSTAPPRTAIR